MLTLALCDCLFGYLFDIQHTEITLLKHAHSKTRTCTQLYASIYNCVIFLLIDVGCAVNTSDPAFRHQLISPMMPSE